MSNLYNVKFYDDSDFSPFIIDGPNIEKLRSKVESILSYEERFRCPYDTYCLAVNIYGVNEDAASGMIDQPKTDEEYITAIVEDYRTYLKQWNREQILLIPSRGFSDRC